MSWWLFTGAVDECSWKCIQQQRAPQLNVRIRRLQQILRGVPYLVRRKWSGSHDEWEPKANYLGYQKRFSEISMERCNLGNGKQFNLEMALIDCCISESISGETSQVSLTGVWTRSWRSWWTIYPRKTRLAFLVRLPNMIYCWETLEEFLRPSIEETWM